MLSILQLKENVYDMQCDRVLKSYVEVYQLSTYISIYFALMGYLGHKYTLE